MNSFTIAITTFSKRLEYIEHLIPQIRKYCNNKILLIVNGEKNGDFIDEYRLQVLKLSAEFKHVYPIFFIETRGLSKLWNTGLINSVDDNVLMLNDDLEIRSNDMFEKTIELINSPNFTGLAKFNGSFSHFIVNKQIIDKLGYFDERLLGFGEEDGDITFRMMRENMKVDNVPVSGVINIVSNVRHDHIKPGIGKYSNFNRQFIYESKYSPNISAKHKGIFDTPMDQKLEDFNQYPYEKFFMYNKNNL